MEWCKQLVPLPRNPTVSQILNQFRDEYQTQSFKRSSSRETKPDDVINEVVEGLKLYFDRALGNILLYRFERQQYLDIKRDRPEERMSDIYGAEHLIRLFGK